jgi:hypothetical protein
MRIKKREKGAEKKKNGSTSDMSEEGSGSIRQVDTIVSINVLNNLRTKKNKFKKEEEGGRRRLWKGSDRDQLRVKEEPRRSLESLGGASRASRASEEPREPRRSQRSLGGASRASEEPRRSLESLGGVGGALEEPREPRRSLGALEVFAGISEYLRSFEMVHRVIDAEGSKIFQSQVVLFLIHTGICEWDQETRPGYVLSSEDPQEAIWADWSVNDQVVNSNDPA